MRTQCQVENVPLDPLLNGCLELNKYNQKAETFSETIPALGAIHPLRNLGLTHSGDWRGSILIQRGHNLLYLIWISLAFAELAI